MKNCAQNNMSKASWLLSVALRRREAVLHVWSSHRGGTGAGRVGGAGTVIVLDPVADTPCGARRRAFRFLVSSA